MEKTKHNRKWLIIGLFIFAPFVGEYLVGDIPLVWILALPVLGLLYGSGALLIREISRRFNLTMTGFLMLCLAYGIFEEGFVAQTLFNSHYMGLGLQSYGYISWLHMGIWWTLFVLTLHTIWSTTVPILTIESLSKKSGKVSWLNKRGIIIALILYIFGALVLIVRVNNGFKFHGSVEQKVCALIIIVLLVAFGSRCRKNKAIYSENVSINLGIIIFMVVGILGFVFLILSHMRSSMVWYEMVIVMCLILLTFYLGARYLEKREGENHTIIIAFSSALLLDYGVYSLFQPPVMPVANAVYFPGKIVCLIIAFGIISWMIKVNSTKKHRVD